MSNENTEVERREYLDERNMLIEAERETAGNFDKYMLMLSAGALGLTLTFIKEIAAKPICNQYFLFLGWIGFVLALLSTLASFLFSQSALRRQRDIIESIKKDEKNVWGILTNILNWCSIVFFIAGVGFIIFFAATNVK